MTVTDDSIRRCEADYAFYYLNNVDYCLYSKCNNVRKATGTTVDNECVNKWDCRNHFGTASTLGNTILTFRQLLWKTKDNNVSAINRQIALAAYLSPCKLAIECCCHIHINLLT
jgi:hypothetical protein